MRAFYVEADYAPREGYVLSQREKDTGRALRGNKIWKNIRGSVVDRPMPVCGDDQVLLKVGAAGICGTDQHLLRKDADGYTMYDGHSKYPIITGHEFSGEIVEVGKNVKKLAVGDLVSVESMHWCGQCDACRRGMFNQCKDLEEPGLTYDGGFAEYAAVNAKYCYKLNDIMNFYGGDKMTASMVCATSGATVIVVDPVAARRENAMKYGATYTVDPTAGDVEEQIKKLTNGRGASVVIECSGNDIGIASLFDIAGHSARVGVVGHSIGRKVPVEIGKTIWKTLHIAGSGGTTNWFPRTIRFMSKIKDTYDFKALVSHYYKFDDLAEAMKMAQNKELSRKVMLTFPE